MIVLYDGSPEGGQSLDTGTAPEGAWDPDLPDLVINLRRAARPGPEDALTAGGDRPGTTSTSTRIILQNKCCRWYSAHSGRRCEPLIATGMSTAQASLDERSGQSFVYLSGGHRGRTCSGTSLPAAPGDPA